MKECGVIFMAAITLYKDKVNGVGSLIDDIIKSVNNLNVQLGTLKNTLEGVESSSCDLNDTVESIRSSSKSEDEKIDDLKKLNKKLSSFIETASDRDHDAKAEINEEKEEFYTKYSYLKPESEKSLKEKILDKIDSFVDSAADWCKDRWNDIKEGFDKFVDWCKSAWNTIKEFNFFDFVGTLIHNPTFLKVVEAITKFAYNIHFYDFIKFIAKTGTQLALFSREHPWIADIFPPFGILAEAAPTFFSITLCADMDEDGVYHIRPDCWQQYVHYSTGYDDVFMAGVNKASDDRITVDVNQSEMFWADLNQDGVKDEGEEFIIWSWKGDYTNLGAGAETGIYQVVRYDDDKSYIYAEIDRNYSADMSLELYYNDDLLYNYSPDEEQWWITGFDPLQQNVRSDELRAVTTIDFSSFENPDLMLDAFIQYNGNNNNFIVPERNENGQYDSYTVTLDWEG